MRHICIHTFQSLALRLRKKLAWYLLEISHRYDEKLLQGHPFILSSSSSHRSIEKEFNKPAAHVECMIAEEITDELPPREENLAPIKNLFLMRTSLHYTRKEMKEQRGPVKSSLSWKVDLEKGRYLLSISSKLFGIWGPYGGFTGQNGIAALIYIIRRLVSSLLGLRSVPKSHTDHGTSSSLKVNLLAHRAKLLRKTALVIVHETSVLIQKFFDLVDVLLKDLRCFYCSTSWPRAGVISMMVAKNYWQLLLLVSSRW